MTVTNDIPVEERLVLLLRELNIKNAHIAAGVLPDWIGLVHRHPEVINSLTLISPQGFDADSLRPLEDRLLVITGDSGPVLRQASEGLSLMGKVTHIALPDCFNAIWTDLSGDRTQELGEALTGFLSKIDPAATDVPPANLKQSEGEVGGISYRIRGKGPPLILLPLGLSPSQWEPLIPQLSSSFSTVTLGGAFVGAIRNHEERARRGYRPMVARFVDELDLQEGQSVLDVGCGSGVHDRYLARRTEGRNQITAVDHSPYMLREAAGIANSQGVGGLIHFQEGNAEHLPFPDSSFDRVMSVTVMEEVNADLMLAEMVRVAKPGGNVGVVVRAVDLPWVINLPVSDTIRRKAEAPGVSIGGGATEFGCGDSTLYRRFAQAGLVSLKIFPQLATFIDGPAIGTWQSQAFSVLAREEQEEWREARNLAEADGTFFMACHFHCVVGTKPPVG